MNRRVAAPADAAGVRHPPAGADARIVSLVPSLTELLFDLGLAAQVVGRTAFCVHPRELVRGVRSVGGTKTINFDKLRRLEPTHVLVNVDETPRALADQLRTLGCTVVVTHPIKVRDNLALYRLIGGLFGRSERAEELCRDFETAFARLREAASGAPRQRVLYLIWKSPWMTVGRETYISRMLALIRWHTWPQAAADRYPQVTLDPTTLAEVDRVLFASEPFPFTESHLQEFRDAFPEHRAKARTIDGEMVSWYGSRAVAGLAYLASLIDGHG
jgi:ABC-type Fe3+-hydroxamate transport system substrate-binding protein